MERKRRPLLLLTAVEVLSSGATGSGPRASSSTSRDMTGEERRGEERRGRGEHDVGGRCDHLYTVASTKHRNAAPLRLYAGGHRAHERRPIATR